MKILYLSCHSILEWSEIKLFTELGHDVFSHGSFWNLAGDGLRPTIPGLKPYQHLMSLASRFSKEDLHQEMIDWADVIMVMHEPKWIVLNWQKMKGKTVIWRSIGQSDAWVEKLLVNYRAEGLKIVRYSPTENGIVGFVGSDALIRFYADENDPWTGDDERILAVVQNFKHRGGQASQPYGKDFVGYRLWSESTSGLPRIVYGTENDNLGKDSGGVLPYEELRKAYTKFRCFYAGGTVPASYNLNFLEAWSTGIPVVAPSKRMIHDEFPELADTYEVNDLISNAETGFIVDSAQEAREVFEKLLADLVLAKKIGDAGKAKAKEYFGRDAIAQQWKDFFATIMQ